MHMNNLKNQAASMQFLNNLKNRCIYLTKILNTFICKKCKDNCQMWWLTPLTPVLGSH